MKGIYIYISKSISLPTLFSFPSIATRQAVLFFHKLPCWDVLSHHHVGEAVGPDDHGSELMSQTTSFLHEVLSSGVSSQG